LISLNSVDSVVVCYSRSETLHSLLTANLNLIVPWYFVNCMNCENVTEYFAI